GKPNVYGSIFRFDGQASVFDARRGPCYRCLYPEPPPPHLVPSCAEGGVLGVLPGVIGTIQAIEAIKLLAGIGDTLLGRLLLFDALRMEFRTLKLRAQHDKHTPITKLIDYDAFCNPANAGEVTTLPPGAIAVDVRERFEWNAGHIDGARHIPLGELANRLDELPRDAEIVLYCASGSRSSRALDVLRDAGFTRAKHLKGGYDGWLRTARQEKSAGKPSSSQEENLMPRKIVVFSAVSKILRDEPFHLHFWEASPKEILQYLKDPRGFLSKTGLDLPKECRIETVIENHDFLAERTNGMAAADCPIIVCNIAGENAASHFNRVSLYAHSQTEVGKFKKHLLHAENEAERPVGRKK